MPTAAPLKAATSRSRPGPAPPAANRPGHASRAAGLRSLATAQPFGAVQAKLQRRPQTKLQAKLKVGPANDRYEAEADRVADQVMCMPAPQAASGAPPDGAAPPSITPLAGTAPVHRMCSHCQEELSRKPETVQRVCAHCEDEISRKAGDGTVQRQGNEEEEIQAKEAPGATPQVSASTEALIGGLGGGAPLPASERAFFEPRLGRDLSSVRIHSGARADAAARSINARAFTLGSDIAFASGEYRPGSSEGRRLMAHELTHTMQQLGAPLHAAGPVAESGPRAVQRLPHDGERRRRSDPRGLGPHSTLPYREAQELVDCVRILGEDAAPFCRSEVLGEPYQPAAPAPAAPTPVFAAASNCADWKQCIVITSWDVAGAMVRDTIAAVEDVRSNGNTSAHFAAVDACFPGASRAQLDEVHRVLSAIAAELRTPINAGCISDCEGTALAETTCRPNADVGFCPAFFVGVDCRTRAAAIIHEIAHHIVCMINPAIEVTDTETGETERTGDVYRHFPEFAGLTAAQALQNPDSFAVLCLNTSTRADCFECSSNFQLQNEEWREFEERLRWHRPAAPEGGGAGGAAQQIQRTTDGGDPPVAIGGDAPQSLQRTVGGRSSCTANADNAPDDPLEALAGVDAMSQNMALGTSGVLFLEPMNFDEPTIGRTALFSAYASFFGTPERTATGRWRSRFRSATFATENEAIEHELETLSRRYESINGWLARDIHYVCPGTSRFTIPGCSAGPCTHDAETCAGGSRTIAICPTFWTLRDPKQENQAGLLIHEALHPLFHFEQHQTSTLARRGRNPACYQNLVYEAFGTGLLTDDCPRL